MNKEKEAEFIKTARQRFERSIKESSENRQNGVDDLRMINGDQWPDDIKNKRARSKKPCLTANKFPSFIDQLIGEQRQNKPKIKTRPKDSESSVEIAKIYDGIIRDIEYQSNANYAYDNAFKQGVSCGMGYYRIVTEYESDTSFEQVIRIKRITNPFTVYFDPEAKEPDCSDANWCFISEYMNENDFKKKYPNAGMIETPEGLGEQKEHWYDNNNVRIAEYWLKEYTEKTIVLLDSGEVVDKKEINKLQKELEEDNIKFNIVKERVVKTYEIKRYLINGSEILEDGKLWPGKYIPIVPSFGKEMNIEGKRYYISLIRHAKDSQRMYNYWRTAITEIVALAPKAHYLLTPEQVKGHESKWNLANTEDYPYLLYNQKAGQTQPVRNMPSPMPSGAYAESQAVAFDMKSIVGMHGPALGESGNETSGKAIIARQRESDIGTFEFVDNHTSAIKYGGRIIVDLIPKIIDTERILRLRNEDGTDQKVTVNQNIKDDFGNTKKVNDLSRGEYEVIVDTGPNYTTARIESANAMMQIIQYMPDSGKFIMDLVAKNLDIKEAQEIEARWRKLLPPGLATPKEGEPPPQPQRPQPPTPKDMLDEKKLQLEFQKLQLEVGKMRTEMERIKTDRFKIVADATSSRARQGR